jgi:integrase
MATPRIQTREARSKLTARDRPYYVELRRGLHLGYRKGTTAGSWLVREHRDGRFIKRRIGTTDDHLPADGVSVLTWAQAQSVALSPERPTVTVPGRFTVAQAWTDYCETRATPIDARELVMWAQFIGPTLSDKSIADLTTGQLQGWLAAQATKHGQRRKSTETDPRERRRRAQYTANRRLNLLKAVLNDAFVKSPAAVPNDTAWRRVRAYRNVDRPRLVTVTEVEAGRLLNALPADIRALARGALYSGCRLGELEALTVADIGEGAVHIRHSKSGRSRHVPLSREGRRFFEGATAGKAGSELVFAQVSRVTVSRAMRAACKVAKISPAASFHDLRRSYGSLLINADTPVEVIQDLLGHADSRMTRRVYSHLQQQTLARYVTKNLPSFGREKTTVIPLKRRARAQ